MVRHGRIQSGSGDRPIVERSLFVTRVVLIPFPIGDRRVIEILVFEFGGEPYGIERTVIFNQSIWRYVCHDVMIYHE